MHRRGAPGWYGRSVRGSATGGRPGCAAAAASKEQEQGGEAQGQVCEEGQGVGLDGLREEEEELKQTSAIARPRGAGAGLRPLSVRSSITSIPVSHCPRQVTSHIMPCRRGFPSSRPVLRPSYPSCFPINHISSQRHDHRSSRSSAPMAPSRVVDLGLLNTTPTFCVPTPCPRHHQQLTPSIIMLHAPLGVQKPEEQSHTHVE